MDQREDSGPTEVSLQAAESELSLPGAFPLLISDPGELNRRTSAEKIGGLPWRLYGLGTALGLGLSELVGEANTGALYVFGGGVFNKVAGVGEWIAFMAIVPILAGVLALLHRKSDLTWDDHLTFSLHFGAVVGFGIAIEGILVTLLSDTLFAPAAMWVMLILVGVYYSLAVADTYGKDVAEVAKGYIAIGAVFTSWLAVSTLLWWFTDFTL